MTSFEDRARADARRRYEERFSQALTSGAVRVAQEDAFVAGAKWARELETTEAQVEAAAEAMKEQGPTPMWDDWVWHRYARAALLAAKEAGR